MLSNQQVCMRMTAIEHQCGNCPPNRVCVQGTGLEATSLTPEGESWTVCNPASDKNRTLMENLSHTGWING